jgi:hypothetical protein
MRSETRLTIVNRDPVCSKWLRATSAVTVLKHPVLKKAHEAQNIFVLVRASGLGEVAAFVREANRRNQLRALLIHADLEERWIGQMLHRANLRTLRHTHVHRDHLLPCRVLKAWEFGCQDILIADAVALADRLIVLTCDLNRLEVPWNSISVLSRMKPEKRADFQVDSDGSYLHWPDGDIHLGIEAFREAVDPVFREAALRREQISLEQFGRAIAMLRERHGVRQGAIPGLSSRQVRRIERGEGFPRVSTLEKLAGAHVLSLNEYLDRLARLQQGGMS